MKLGITMLIHDKDDIEFVNEFTCFLGHPVEWIFKNHTLKALNIPFKKVVLPGRVKCGGRKGEKWWLMAAGREKR